MMAGVVAGQARPLVQLAPVAGPVSIIGSSLTTYETATSQNQTTPAGIAAGDLLLAFVMHRSALTAPAGWVLVASQPCVYTITTQWMSVYKKVTLPGDSGSSTSWAQAESGVISVHIHAYRKNGGCDVVDFDSYAIGGGSSLSAPYAVSTATADDQIGVMAGTAIFVTAASPSMEAAPGTRSTPASVANNRMCVAYVPRSTGQQTVGSFTRGGAIFAGLEAWALVSLIVG